MWIRNNEHGIEMYVKFCFPSSYFNFILSPSMSKRSILSFFFFFFFFLSFSLSLSLSLCSPYYSPPPPTFFFMETMTFLYNIKLVFFYFSVQFSITFISFFLLSTLNNYLSSFRSSLLCPISFSYTAIIIFIL